MNQSSPGGPTTADTGQPAPTADDARADAVLEQLEEDRKFFDDVARTSRLAYLIVKVIQLVLAAAVPVAASVHAPVWVTGSLGAAIVVLEGMQQLFQWQSGWIRSRTAEEQLRHEQFEFRARAGDYKDDATRVDNLVTRMRQITSAEASSWMQTARAAVATEGQGGKARH